MYICKINVICNCFCFKFYFFIYFHYYILWVHTAKIRFGKWSSLSTAIIINGNSSFFYSHHHAIQSSNPLISLKISKHSLWAQIFTLSMKVICKCWLMLVFDSLVIFVAIWILCMSIIYLSFIYHLVNKLLGISLTSRKLLFLITLVTDGEMYKCRCLHFAWDSEWDVHMYM